MTGAEARTICVAFGPGFHHVSHLLGVTRSTLRRWFECPVVPPDVERRIRALEKPTQSPAREQVQAALDATDRAIRNQRVRVETAPLDEVAAREKITLRALELRRDQLTNQLKEQTR